MPEQLTRRERRKLETRREILDAALACFSESGYHATGIGDIASRVGVAHGTFYLYFESKRDLVEQVLDDLIARLGTALAEVPPEAPASLADYQRQADRISSVLGKVITEDLAATRFLLLQAAAVDGSMSERVLDFFELAATIQAGYLQHGVDAGYFRDDLDVAQASRAVNGMLFAAALYQLRDPGISASAELARTIREIIYHGLAGPRR